MSKRVKVLHRQTFQNSNNIVELTVKTIPKDVQTQKLPCNQPPFVRECALKKELEKVKDKENNNIVDKPPAAPTKLKNSGGRVTVEVSKKSSRKRHDIVPKDNTWNDVLRNCSTIASLDESDVSDRASGLKKRQLVSRGRSNHAQTWHPRTSQTPDTEQSNTPELIVNRQIQSGETSPQEFRSQRMHVNIREQNFNNQGSSSNSSISISNRRMRRSLGVKGYRGGRSQLSSNNVAQEAILDVQPNQQLEQSNEPKIPGNDRLLSDDVNASPFGESALQLLHQLRQRLQSRGDSEGMDIVGVVEAFITGQGSMGGVGGAGNIPQSASTVSPVCPSVFPTPAANIPTLTTNIPMPVSTNIQQYTHIPPRPNQFKYPDVQNPINNIAPPQPSQPEYYYPADQQPHSQIPSNVQHIVAAGVLLHDNQGLQPAEEQTPQQGEPAKQNSDEILRREIAKQHKIISEQEGDILQLRTLSTRLIRMQERLTSQNQEGRKKGNGPIENGIQLAEPVRTLTQTQESQTEEFQVEKPTHDWDSTTPSSDRDYRSTLLLLQTENETLRKEVRRLRDITMDLQNQLTKAYGDLDSERRSRSRLSGLSSSKLSGSAPNLDLVEHHYKESIPEKLVPSKAPSNHGESEVDSAYEEKTSSRLTSKVGSPHLDKDGQECGIAKAVHAFPSCVRDSVSELQNLNVTGGQLGFYRQMRSGNDPSRETTAPSIARNMTSLSEQVPSQSAFPSMELCNSHSNFEKGCASKMNYNFAEDQRGPSIDPALNSDISRYAKAGNGNSGIAKRNNPAVPAAVIGNINSDIAVLVSDVEHKQGKVMEDPVYPSFSTVSEESHQETFGNPENSFLQGIHFPRYLSGSRAINREMDPNKDVIHSVNEIENPTMESTRVRGHSSPPQFDSSVEPSFAPVKGNNTLTSTLLTNVEELQ